MSPLPTGARILIVDDSPENVELLERLLGRAGFEQIVSTSDPQEAVPLFEQVAPDIVLLDLHMPFIDGFQVLQEIRARTPDVFVPIIVLTGDQSGHIKARALATGANDFLTKPFDRMEVVLRMSNLLETRRLHLDLQAKNLMLEMQARQGVTPPDPG
jgi:putative two-component system response regulator